MTEPADSPRPFPYVLLLAVAVLLVLNLLFGLAGVPPTATPGPNALGHAFGRFLFSGVLVPVVTVGIAVISPSRRSLRGVLLAISLGLCIGAALSCTSALPMLAQRVPR